MTTVDVIFQIRGCAKGKLTVIKRTQQGRHLHVAASRTKEINVEEQEYSPRTDSVCLTTSSCLSFLIHREDLHPCSLCTCNKTLGINQAIASVAWRDKMETTRRPGLLGVISIVVLNVPVEVSGTDCLEYTSNTLSPFASGVL